MINERNTRIWEEIITIPTYPTLPPDSPWMFFEDRGNQGAGGWIYPNPITDRLTHEGKSDQEYQAVFWDNEYIQLMVLLHHRSSTSIPVEYKLEQSADGSVTLWMSEHEPMKLSTIWLIPFASWR